MQSFTTSLDILTYIELRICTYIYEHTFTVNLREAVEGPILASTSIHIELGGFDGEGKVDIEDLVLLTKAFGSHPLLLRWNLYADLNDDNKVNIKDLVLVIKHYGEHYP